MDDIGLLTASPLRIAASCTSLLWQSPLPNRKTEIFDVYSSDNANAGRIYVFCEPSSAACACGAHRPASVCADRQNMADDSYPVWQHGISAVTADGELLWDTQTRYWDFSSQIKDRQSFFREETRDALLFHNGTHLRALDLRTGRSRYVRLLRAAIRAPPWSFSAVGGTFVCVAACSWSFVLPAYPPAGVGNDANWWRFIVDPVHVSLDPLASLLVSYGDAQLRCLACRTK